ncbi:hypothetical protein [Liberiplasma polymorphum]|uniref:hypothetical protein n=1 Tax=Liberiplasma polymorphum TaxID=3374570 RepID=UPI003771522D
MNIIYILLPLPILILSSYFFNFDKLTTSKKNIALLSTLTGIISYKIVLVVFLESAINVFLVYFLILILILITSYITVRIINAIDEDVFLISETVKNNILLFVLSFIPFYLMLTILRFEPTTIQFSMASLSVVLLLILPIFLQKKLLPLYEKIGLWYSHATVSKYVVLWLILVFFSVFFFIIQLPTNQMKQSLNLSDSIRYFNFDTFPNQLTNDYQFRTEFEIISDDFIKDAITDFYFDENHLYIYTETDVLMVYSITNGELIRTELLENFAELDDSHYPMTIHNKFFVQDNQLYLLGRQGLFLVSLNTSEKISDFSTLDSTLFIQEDQYYLLHKSSETLYEIYKLSNETLILEESIDVLTLSYEAITVISYTLFFTTEDAFILKDDLTEFARFSGEPVYDKTNQILYYISLNNITKTTYYKVTSDGSVRNFVLNNPFNNAGFINDGRLYLVNSSKDTLNRVEILGDDFAFKAIHYPLRSQPFYRWQGYNSAYIADYQVDDYTVLYLQVEYHADEVKYSLVRLEQLDVSFMFPLYSHFTLTYFLPILLALFIPFTQTPSITQIIGFESYTRKKD